MEEHTKICARCGESRPKDQFSRRAASKDGLQARCKLCVSVGNRKYHEANREKRVAYMTDRYQRLRDHELERARTYREANPEKVLAAASNHYWANAERLRADARVRMANARAGWTDERRDEFREYLKIWVEDNRERARELARAWRKAHPEYCNERSRRRYAMKRDATIVKFTLKQLEDRMSMFAGCWMCGGPKECVDHVKPLAKGGAHCLANLAAACTSCNSRKSDAWDGPCNTVRRFRKRRLGAVPVVT